jgi:hypothetical protein
MSFRYYDPVIILIQEKLSKNRRQYLMVKKQLKVIFDKKLSLEGQFNELMKQDDNNNRPKKASNAGSTRVDFLTFDELHPGEINHYKSHHVQ